MEKFVIELVNLLFDFKSGEVSIVHVVSHILRIVVALVDSGLVGNESTASDTTSSPPPVLSSGAAGEPTLSDSIFRDVGR